MNAADDDEKSDRRHDKDDEFQEEDDEEEEDGEEEDDEDDDEDDDDDDDADEEEPILKYARVTEHLGGVYRAGDATSSSLVLGDKMVCCHLLRCPSSARLPVIFSQTVG